MIYQNVCTRCLQMYKTEKPRSQYCSMCNKKEVYKNIKYKNRFCIRCDNKFRSTKKRAKICPNCLRKPYQNIFD